MKTFKPSVILTALCSMVLFCHSLANSAQNQDPAREHSALYDTVIMYLHDFELLIQIVVAVVIILFLNRSVRYEIKAGLDQMSTILGNGIGDLCKSAKQAITSGMATGYSNLESQITPLLDRWIQLPDKIDRKLTGLRSKVLGYYQRTEDKGLQEQINEIEDMLFDKKFPEAEINIHRMIAENSKNEDVRILYGKYFAAKEKFDEAEEQLTIAERINPQSPEVHFVRALNRVAQGDYVGAESSAKRAISLNPEDPRYLVSRGFIKWNLGELEEAIKFTEEADLVAVHEARTKMLIKNNLAYYLAERGQPGDIERALPLTDELVELLGTVKVRKPAGDKQYQTRGWVYLRLYQLKEKRKEWLELAISNANKALDINPKNKFAVETLRTATKLLFEHKER